MKLAGEASVVDLLAARGPRPNMSWGQEPGMRSTVHVNVFRAYNTWQRGGLAGKRKGFQEIKMIRKLRNKNKTNKHATKHPALTPCSNPSFQLPF